MTTGKLILIDGIILRSLFTLSVVVLMMSKSTTSECPSNLVVHVTGQRGEPNAEVMFDEPINQTCTPGPGSELTIGTHPVMCIGDDGGSCSFTVTVVDQARPVINGCPQTITKHISYDLSQPQMSTTVVTWDLPSASDNSGQVTLTTPTHQPGAEFPIGSTEVVYTATDSSGNTKQCIITVQVTAVYAPPKDKIFIKNLANPTNCLSVTWPNSQDSATTFSIYTYKEGEGKPTSRERIVAPRGSSTYMYMDLCGLQAGQLYTVEVESVFSGKAHTASAQHYTRPLPPTELKVITGTLSPSSLVLSWDRSQQGVDQYQVFTENRWQYVSNTTDRVLVDLNPHTQNEMLVQSVVGSGNRRPPDNWLWHSQPMADLQDSELIAYNFTESTIKVAWKAVSGTSDALNPYMLIIEPQDAVENYLKVFNSAEAQFRGLKPNTEYRIQLLSNLGFQLETTQRTRPGRVRNLRAVKVLEDFITLKWDQPTEGDVDSYDVAISPGSWSEPTNMMGTSFEFSSLTNETEYFITVVSVYKGMKSNPQTTIVTTGVTKPVATDPLENVALVVVGCVLGVLIVIQLIVIVIICFKCQGIKKKHLDSHVYDDTILREEGGDLYKTSSAH